MKYFVIDAHQVVGCYTSLADVKQVRADHPDANVIKTIDELSEFYSEPQMRQIRAGMNLPDGSDREMEQQRRFQREPEFANKAKKSATAKRLWEDLQAMSVAAKTGTKPTVVTAKRSNIKTFLRELFPKKGVEKTADEISGDGRYSPVSLSTALSDLRSEKYSGDLGVVNIKRVKEDGIVRYVRIA